MRDPLERFTLTVEALPDDVDPAIRVRRLLKMALRTYRLRCTAIGDANDAPPSLAQDASADAEATRGPS